MKDGPGYQPGPNPISTQTREGLAMKATPSTCSVPDCGRANNAKGLCQPHYNRLRRLGDPLAGAPIRSTKRPQTCVVDGCNDPRSRADMCRKHQWRTTRYGSPDLPSRADKIMRCVETSEDGCWNWSGPLNSFGYGRFAQKLAHRVSYEILSRAHSRRFGTGPSLPEP
jgi:hypothetical protein